MPQRPVAILIVELDTTETRAIDPPDAVVIVPFHKDDNKMVVFFEDRWAWAGEDEALPAGLSEREIRTRLDFLKKAGNLTSRSTNRYAIITITNWDS